MILIFQSQAPVMQRYLLLAVLWGSRHSNIAGGSINWYNIYKVKLEVSFKITKRTLFDSGIQPLKNLSDTHPSMCLK